jgi:hypothetical protein
VEEVLVYLESSIDTIARQGNNLYLDYIHLERGDIFALSKARMDDLLLRRSLSRVMNINL